MSGSSLLAVVSGAVARIIRAAEYADDGEIEVAVQVLLDLERELRAALQGRAA